MTVKTLNSAVYEAKEQKTFNSWHERFQRYLEDGKFERAKKYAERKKVKRPLVCDASYDFFRMLIEQGRKSDYLRMIREFQGYNFDCWLPDSKPKPYKSARRLESRGEKDGFN